jgi:hypothetical protein
VATAAAQIVNYWKYPTVIDFSEADHYTTDTRLIDIDFDAGQLGFPTLAELDAQLAAIQYPLTNAQVAALGFGLGVKYEMDYTANGSGAHTSDGASVFLNDLNYGQAKWDVWSAEVQQQVIRNIQAGWPVLLAIANQGGGHSVVVEGYRNDNGDEFYINMGWGGAGDDWYALPDISPVGLPGFDRVRGAVYDICPLMPWSQEGADIRNSQSSPYEIPAEYRERWHVEVESGSAVSGICAGQGGLVYLTIAPANYGSPCTMLIVDQYGSRKASISLPASSSGTIGPPVQAPNGDVFVPNDDGIIYRIDPKTSVVTKIFTEPTKTNDQITHLKIDERGRLYAITANGRFYAMDRTGSQLWSSFALPANCANFGSPAIDTALGRIYIPYKNISTNTGYLVMLDALSGTALFTKNLGSVPAASWTPGTPTIGSENIVFITCNTVLYALDPRNNLATEWTNSTTTWSSASAIGADGTVYVYHNNFLAGGNEYVAALDPSDGRVCWTTDGLVNLNQYSHIGSLCVGADNALCFTVATRATSSSPATYAVYAIENLGPSRSIRWTHNFGTGGGSLAMGPEDTLFVIPGSYSSRRLTAIGSGLGAGRVNNSAPGAVANVGIPDRSMVSSSNVTLSWTCSDPDGDSVSYSVYVQNGNDEYLVASGIFETSYTLPGPMSGGIYSWKVVASDGQAITEDASWSFSVDAIPPTIVDFYSIAGNVITFPSGSALVIPDNGTFTEPCGTRPRFVLVKFSEPIDPGTFTSGSVEICGIGVNGQPLEVSTVSIDTVFINDYSVGAIIFGGSSESLPDLARYAIRIIGVRDVSGNALAGDDDRVFTILRGDVSGDGVVNAVDLARIRANMTAAVVPGSVAQIRADLSLDGKVDALDLSWVRDHIGNDARGIVAPSLPAAMPTSPADETSDSGLTADEESVFAEPGSPIRIEGPVVVNDDEPVIVPQSGAGAEDDAFWADATFAATNVESPQSPHGEPVTTPVGYSRDARQASTFGYGRALDALMLDAVYREYHARSAPQLDGLLDDLLGEQTCTPGSILRRNVRFLSARAVSLSR